MSGTSEGARKAAARQNMSEKGRKGALALNSDPKKKSAASQKAAQTRKMRDPYAFQKMGRAGGSKKKGLSAE